MRIIVDEIPKEQKECLFSERTFNGNYVCKFQGSCIVCNPERCKFLKSISDYGVRLSAIGLIILSWYERRINKHG